MGGADALEASASYEVLPVRLRRGGLVRHIYVRRGETSDNLPKDRTLFVNGLPAQLDEGSLLELFSRVGGSLERAALHGTKRSAVLLFETAAGREAVLQAAAKGKTVEYDLPEPSQPFGLKGGNPQLGWCCCFSSLACEATAHQSATHTSSPKGPPQLPSMPPLCSLGGAAQGAEARQRATAAAAGRVG